MKFDNDKFAKDLILFRQVIRRKLNLRDASVETGVSAPTLSRLESGSNPEINTFALLCGWMKKEPSDYFEQVKTEFIPKYEKLD